MPSVLKAPREFKVAKLLRVLIFGQELKNSTQRIWAVENNLSVIRRDQFMKFALEIGVSAQHINAVVDEMIVLDFEVDEWREAVEKQELYDPGALIEYFSGKSDAQNKSETEYGEYNCQECSDECPKPWVCIDVWGDEHTKQPDSSGWFSQWYCQKCRDAWRVSSHRIHSEHVRKADNGSRKDDGPDSGDDYGPPSVKIKSP